MQNKHNMMAGNLAGGGMSPKRDRKALHVDTSKQEAR